VPVPDGLVVVDKPSGWTSHDVVAQVRKLAHTRKVGHAGTLDPMATGVLVLGVERATRLLTYMVGADKEYEATIRLGESTVTDDAEGDVLDVVDAGDVTDEAIEQAMAPLRGSIDQIPSSVSAVKVGGRRSYARVRAGEVVELAARPVVVRRFEALAIRRSSPRERAVVDVDVVVECSSGTYVRALARDMGGALGVGGHLAALRRTRLGPYTLSSARTLEELAADFQVMPLAEVARKAFPVRELSADEARRLAHGQRLKAVGMGDKPVAAFDPDGWLVALVSESGPTARPLLVLRG